VPTRRVKMVKSPDEMRKLQSEMTQTTHQAMQKALDGFRRLAEVNMQAARDSLEQSAEQINALLAAKDVSTVTQLVTTFAQPSADKFTAYAQAVTAVARDTQSELAALVQQQIAKGNAQFAATIEELARNTPAGSEGAMALIKQAMATANANYEQLNQTMRQMVDTGTAAAEAATGKRKR
jgi:phasin family protein